MGKYRLVPEEMIAGMVREMKRRAENGEAEYREQEERAYAESGLITAYRDRHPAHDYAAALEHATPIDLPELHTFAFDGVEIQVGGWSREDALANLRREYSHMPDAEWHWTGSQSAWPGHAFSRRFVDEDEHYG